MSIVQTRDGALLRTTISGLSANAEGFGLPSTVITADLFWPSNTATAGIHFITRPEEHTTASPNAQIANIRVETAAEAIFEIRRRSNLTWEEIADLFGVTRRSVHHWVSGKAATREHNQRIRRTLTIIRQIDQGEADRTRDYLLSPGDDGRLPFDLIKDEIFQTAPVIGAIQSSLGTVRLP